MSFFHGFPVGPNAADLSSAEASLETGPNLVDARSPHGRTYTAAWYSECLAGLSQHFAGKRAGWIVFLWSAWA